MSNTLPRRVALNCRFSGAKQGTGTHHVAHSLFQALVEHSRDFELFIFADSRFGEISEWTKHPGITFINVPFQNWSSLRRHLWEQLILPIHARRFGCQIIHSPIMTAPLWKNSCKSIMTIHDLNFQLHPEWFSLSFRLLYRLVSALSAKRADCVVAISNYVQAQVQEHLHISADKLKMVYNGLRPLTHYRPLEGRLRSSPYILTVGALQPHKNLLRLIHVFVSLKRKYPQLKLVVVGKRQDNFRYEKQLEEMLQTDGVELTGYLSNEELADVYRQAKVFCYPSLEEGFGLPILEAMSFGVPVLTSNLSCLPEIAGQAAVLCDPYSAQDMKNKLESMLNLSETEIRALVAAGLRRSETFSWKETARQYIEIYQKLFLQ